MTNAASYEREFKVAWPSRLCKRAIANTQTAMGATYALIAKSKSFTGSGQFLRGSHDLGFANFFLGATARARSMTAKVLRLEELG